DEGAQLVRELGLAGPGLVDPLAQAGDGAIERLLYQLVAVAEVEIDGALGDARLLGDVLHGGGGHPLAGDDAHGGVLDGLDAELLDDFFLRLDAHDQPTERTVSRSEFQVSVEDCQVTGVLQRGLAVDGYRLSITNRIGGDDDRDGASRGRPRPCRRGGRRRGGRASRREGLGRRSAPWSRAEKRDPRPRSREWSA